MLSVREHSRSHWYYSHRTGELHQHPLLVSDQGDELVAHSVISPHPAPPCTDRTLTRTALKVTKLYGAVPSQLGRWSRFTQGFQLSNSGSGGPHDLFDSVPTELGGMTELSSYFEMFDHGELGGGDSSGGGGRRGGCRGGRGRPPPGPRNPDSSPPWPPPAPPSRPCPPSLPSPPDGAAAAAAAGRRF